MAESLYEPDPRFRPYSSVINGELCVWGGTVATTSLQVYHLSQESWRQLETHGPSPPGLFAGASAHSESYLYVYDGVKDDLVSHSGCLHRLDTKTSSWTQLAAYSANAPMKKVGCGMIMYENSVIIIGGFGVRNGPIQPGSQWKKWRGKDDEEDPSTKGWTNEMHKYDLREGNGEITRYGYTLSYKEILLSNRVFNSGRMNYPNFYEVVKKLWVYTI